MLVFRRWLIDLMIKRPLDSPVQASQTSLIGRKRSILLPPNSHEESIGEGQPAAILRDPIS